MTPRVSVLVRTCNHERFVRESLESALRQETSFDFEIVIGDDESTDGTTSILKEFASEFPHQVRLLLHRPRLGSWRNFRETLNECRGDYIAVLDGDDYWLGVEKLEKQVRMMHEDRGLSLCGHRILVQDEVRGRNYASPMAWQPKRATIEDFLAPNRNGDSAFVIPTLSMVVRRAHVPRLPDWTDSVEMGDKSLQLVCGLYGDFGFINKTMGVYRKHKNAAWSTREPGDIIEGHIQYLEASRSDTIAFADVVERRLSILHYRAAYHFSGVDNDRSQSHLQKARELASTFSRLKYEGFRFGRKSAQTVRRLAGLARSHQNPGVAERRDQ